VRVAAGQRQIIASEIEHGLDRATRIVMRCDLFCLTLQKGR
jgi:hypothetical protein